MPRLMRVICSKRVRAPRMAATAPKRRITGQVRRPARALHNKASPPASPHRAVMGNMETPEWSQPVSALDAQAHPASVTPLPRTAYVAVMSTKRVAAGWKCCRGYFRRSLCLRTCGRTVH